MGLLPSPLDKLGGDQGFKIILNGGVGTYKLDVAYMPGSNIFKEDNNG